MNIAPHIENTLLRPDATREDFMKLCEESMEAAFHCVCVPPNRIVEVKDCLRGSSVNVCTVIGFPYGYSTPQSKYKEACEAFEMGASELDMVMPVGVFKDAREHERMVREIEGLVSIGDAVIKVIIETPFLNEDEISQAAKTCVMGRAHYVKTCTGIHGGAQLDDIVTIRKAIAGSAKIKASGGIGSYRDAVAFVEAGAERIGTSKGHKIWQESKQHS